MIVNASKRGFGSKRKLNKVVNLNGDWRIGGKTHGSNSSKDGWLKISGVHTCFFLFFYFLFSLFTLHIWDHLLSLFLNFFQQMYSSSSSSSNITVCTFALAVDHDKSVFKALFVCCYNTAPGWPISPEEKENHPSSLTPKLIYIIIYIYR